MSKARQIRIPSTEPKTIALIEEVAVEYCEARDERMALTKKEVELQARLVAAMQEHEKDLERDEDGNRYYKCQDSIDPEFVVTLIHEKVKAKVKKTTAGEESDAGPEDASESA